MDARQVTLKSSQALKKDDIKNRMNTMSDRVDRDVINALIEGHFADPFSVLGMHRTEAGLEVRATLGFVTIGFTSLFCKLVLANQPINREQCWPHRNVSASDHNEITTMSPCCLSRLTGVTLTDFQEH